MPNKNSTSEKASTVPTTPAEQRRYFAPKAVAEASIDDLASSEQLIGARDTNDYEVKVKTPV